MSLQTYLTTVLQDCPYLTLSEWDLFVDGMQQVPTAFTVDGDPMDPVVKRYLNGDVQRQCVFSLSLSKPSFSKQERAQHAELYENLSGWMRQATRRRQLPAMQAQQQPMSIETQGVLYSPKSDLTTNETYVIKCKFAYYEKERNY